MSLQGDENKVIRKQQSKTTQALNFVLGDEEHGLIMYYDDLKSKFKLSRTETAKADLQKTEAILQIKLPSKFDILWKQIKDIENQAFQDNTSTSTVPRNPQAHEELNKALQKVKYIKGMKKQFNLRLSD